MLDEAAAGRARQGMVRHGGNLAEAVARYGIPREQWLDLSTGINPHGYPVPPIPPEAWRRLPDDDAALAALAARYYGAPHALATAGSQAAIRILPQLLPRGQVGLSRLTYSEYGPAFEGAGHRLVALGPAAGDDLPLGPDLPPGLLHLVVVNPNNPSAHRWPPATLLHWHAQLRARGGTLLVDEAFADTLPALSVAAASGGPGLVVLRSIGKFFGLAGARAGFALAEPALLAALAQALGAWTVGGPAGHAVRAALADRVWQDSMRAQLEHAGQRLQALLAAHGLAPCGTPLFAWAPHPRAEALHEHLARAGIWTRLFDTPPSLRFGLPGDAAGWARLSTALAAGAQLLRGPRAASSLASLGPCSPSFPASSPPSSFD